MPAATYMPDKVQWQLACIYLDLLGKFKAIQLQEFNVETIIKQAPLIATWEYWGVISVKTLVILQPLVALINIKINKAHRERYAVK